MSVSVVIPCLNEEDCIGECVRRVRDAFDHESNLEILVVDNGSTDRSAEIAKSEGATVVEERRRGYGSAILRGFHEASGDILVMGDADNTYDFRDAAKLIELMKEKDADFAIGDRIHGEVEPGAMPWLHRHVGTPILSGVLNFFFGSRVGDINCGLRAFRREKLEAMKLRSTGMEFASEMVIHAHKAGLKFVERPIRYYRRGGGEAKLRTIRDGWRHLRFILLCAPFPLFWIPAVFGMGLSFWCFLQPAFGFQVLGSLLILTTAQLFWFGIFAKTFLWVSDKFLVDQKLGSFLSRFRLEWGALASMVFVIVGLWVFFQVDLSNLIRGATLLAIGAQAFFSSFFLSMLISRARLEA